MSKNGISQCLYLSPSFLAVPSASPSNLTGTEISNTAIEMHWSSVPDPFKHGIILGYKIMARDITANSSTWVNQTLLNTNFSTNYTDLKSFTPYEFRILAFTDKGEGVISESVIVRTGSTSK